MAKKMKSGLVVGPQGPNACPFPKSANGPSTGKGSSKPRDYTKVAKPYKSGK